MNPQQSKVAIVTGAAGMRSIGRAITLRLARAGFDIALVDILREPAHTLEAELAARWRGIESVQGEIAALGRRAIWIHADIGDATQVHAACERNTLELGGVDVLVNNACDAGAGHGASGRPGHRRVGPNAICPGWLDSGRFNLNEKMAVEVCGTSQTEQHRAGLEQQAKNNVMGRIPVAEDIAGIVAFLVSPEAVHISGQAINVDCGELFH